jgi:hypothetical protein
MIEVEELCTGSADNVQQNVRSGSSDFTLERAILDARISLTLLLAVNYVAEAF